MCDSFKRKKISKQLKMKIVLFFYNKLKIIKVSIFIHQKDQVSKNTIKYVTLD